MSTTTPSAATNSIGEQFLDLLPALHSQFRAAFRSFEPEQREDALHEATANAFATFVRLWERGRPQAALPTPLARYAISHWFAGRRVGATLNRGDVSSPYAQRQQRAIRLEQLDRYDSHEGAWNDVLIEDRQTPVPDQAAFRIDFPNWLQQLSRRKQTIALKLAAGNSTSEVAQQFQLSEARVSQLRREFQQSWLKYHGELATPTATTLW